MGHGDMVTWRYGTWRPLAISDPDTCRLFVRNQVVLVANRDIWTGEAITGDSIKSHTTQGIFNKVAPPKIHDATDFSHYST